MGTEPLELGGKPQLHAIMSYSLASPNDISDINFDSYDPAPNSPPDVESAVIIKLDTNGITMAQFADLISVCAICRTYMTKRSFVSHAHCSSNGARTRGTQGLGIRWHDTPSGASAQDATRVVLRLLAYGDPRGGIPETTFYSLFSKCPHCFLFMTWDAARYHDCLFDEMMDKEMIDEEPMDEELMDMESDFDLCLEDFDATL